ncbi:MAG TPA: NlpC/P60 family protein [Rubrobacteraceae bacterium]|nr:NlpC/P60 family protein [Rubrobacteraceae bacterium]
MRRVTLMLLGAILALALLSPAAYSDETTTDSEQDSEYTGEQTTLEEGTASEATEDLGPRPKPMSEVSGPVSQGSAVLGPGLPEENFPDYSQVVDNDSKNFEAPGWKKQSSLSGYYGESYAVAGSAKAKAAQYKVEIPATGKYSVYAWLPADSDNTSAARFGITTASGTKWVKINQQRDGGFWGKIGEYEMKRGESYAVKIAPGSEGRTVADAIAVVRGVLSGPPDDESVSSAEGSTFRASGSRPSGQAVVRKARDHLGKRYKWGTCTSARMSCTCLTRKAFQPFGHKLAMSEGKQWRYAKKRGKVIRSKSNLRPGDLLFFKENGKNGPITHVGVAAKSGWIVHSSAYFGRVVEKQQKYINGFHAGVRLRLR